MPEMPRASEHHRNVVAVGHGDGFFVFLGAAGLDNCGDAYFACGLGAVGEGEKVIGGQDGAVGAVCCLGDGLPVWTLSAAQILNLAKCKR
jgi:hypothetical protein